MRSALKLRGGIASSAPTGATVVEGSFKGGSEGRATPDPSDRSFIVTSKTVPFSLPPKGPGREMRRASCTPRHQGTQENGGLQTARWPGGAAWADLTENGCKRRHRQFARLRYFELNQTPVTGVGSRLKGDSAACTLRGCYFLNLAQTATAMPEPLTREPV